MSVAKGNVTKSVDAGDLSIAYIEHGESDGWPVILSHGFPYDVHAYSEVSTILVEEGARVILPYARGFGQTKFLSKNAIRNGQQAARAMDILHLSDALNLERPILGGFDWGGNASCVAAALWPEKFCGLVSYAGYDVIDVKAQLRPVDPVLEHVFWYQHLFQTERGRLCLAEHRKDLCKLLWREWSPNWQFDDDTFERSASAFDNPDFVDIVIHCYRFVFGLEPCDPQLQHLEDRLAQRPVIKLPAVTIDGLTDPLKPGGTADHAKMFVGRHEHIVVNAGHNVPQEDPVTFAEAIVRIHKWI